MSHSPFINIYGTTNPYIKSFKGVFNRLKRDKVRGCSPISARNFIGQPQMIIYKTTNLVNGKIYVGKDTKNNPKYYGSGHHFKRALKKYKRKNFIKKILEYCKNEEELNERERYWIKELKAQDPNIGYNIIDGGPNPILFGERNWWAKATPEQREHHKKRLKETMPFKDHSNIKGVKKGSIPWNKGIERTDINLDKHYNSKKILVFGIVYNSIKQASIALDIPYDSLRCKLRDVKNLDFTYILETGDGCKKHTGTKILYKGVEYPSIIEASIINNISTKNIRKEATNI